MSAGRPSDKKHELSDELINMFKTEKTIQDICISEQHQAYATEVLQRIISDDKSLDNIKSDLSELNNRGGLIHRSRTADYLTLQHRFFKIIANSVGLKEAKPTPEVIDQLAGHIYARVQYYRLLTVATQLSRELVSILETSKNEIFTQWATRTQAIDINAILSDIATSNIDNMDSANVKLPKLLLFRPADTHFFGHFTEVCNQVSLKTLDPLKSSDDVKALQLALDAATTVEIARKAFTEIPTAHLNDAIIKLRIGEARHARLHINLSSLPRSILAVVIAAQNNTDYADAFKKSLGDPVNFTFPNVQELQTALATPEAKDLNGIQQVFIQKLRFPENLAKTIITAEVANELRGETWSEKLKLNPDELSKIIYKQRNVPEIKQALGQLGSPPIQHLEELNKTKTLSDVRNVFTKKLGFEEKLAESEIDDESRANTLRSAARFELVSLMADNQQILFGTANNRTNKNKDTNPLGNLIFNTVAEILSAHWETISPPTAADLEKLRDNIANASKSEEICKHIMKTFFADIKPARYPDVLKAVKDAVSDGNLLRGQARYAKFIADYKEELDKNPGLKAILVNPEVQGALVAYWSSYENTAPRPSDNRWGNLIAGIKDPNATPESIIEIIRSTLCSNAPSEKANVLLAEATELEEQQKAITRALTQNAVDLKTHAERVQQRQRVLKNKQAQSTPDLNKFLSVKQDLMKKKERLEKEKKRLEKQRTGLLNRAAFITKALSQTNLNPTSREKATALVEKLQSDISLADLGAETQFDRLREKFTDQNNSIAIHNKLLCQYLYENHNILKNPLPENIENLRDFDYEKQTHDTLTQQLRGILVTDKLTEKEDILTEKQFNTIKFRYLLTKLGHPVKNIDIKLKELRNIQKKNPLPRKELDEILKSSGIVIENVTYDKNQQEFLAELEKRHGNLAEVINSRLQELNQFQDRNYLNKITETIKIGENIQINDTLSSNGIKLYEKMVNSYKELSQAYKEIDNRIKILEEILNKIKKLQQQVDSAADKQKTHTTHYAPNAKIVTYNPNDPESYDSALKQRLAIEDATSTSSSKLLGMASSVDESNVDKSIEGKVREGQFLLCKMKYNDYDNSEKEIKWATRVETKNSLQNTITEIVSGPDSLPTIQEGKTYWHGIIPYTFPSEAHIKVAIRMVHGHLASRTGKISNIIHLSSQNPQVGRPFAEATLLYIEVLNTARKEQGLDLLHCTNPPEFDINEIGTLKTNAFKSYLKEKILPSMEDIPDISAHLKELEKVENSIRPGSR